MGKAKKINPEKLAYKYGRILIYETATDYIYGFEKTYPDILEKSKLSGYITDDYSINTMTVINLIILKGLLHDQIAQDMVKVIESMIVLPTCKNRKEQYKKINNQMDKFKDTYSCKEYFSFSRRVLYNSSFSYFIDPIFMAFDYCYYPSGLLLNEGEKISKRKFEGTFEGSNWPIPFCCATSVDHLNAQNPSHYIFFEVLKDFLETSSPILVKKFRSHLLNEEYKNLLTLFSFSISYAFSSNCIFNKFIDGYIIYPSVYLSQQYFYDAQLFERDHMLSKQFIQNIFINIPRDILINRKFIFKDVSFPSLCLGINLMNKDTPEDDEFKIIKEVSGSVEDGSNEFNILHSFHVSERTINDDTNEYHMIYLSYKYKDFTRTVPIVIDNIMSLVGGYTFWDYQAIFVLMGLYEVFEYFPKSMIEDEIINIIIQPFIELTQNISSDMVKKNNENHAKGYHQHKEVYIDAFVRRLPAGQKASPEAKALAEKYHVNLGTDRTIVSGYIRNKDKPPIS